MDINESLDVSNSLANLMTQKDRIAHCKDLIREQEILLAKNRQMLLNTLLERQRSVSSANSDDSSSKYSSRTSIEIGDEINRLRREQSQSLLKLRQDGIKELVDLSPKVASKPFIAIPDVRSDSDNCNTFPRRQLHMNDSHRGRYSFKAYYKMHRSNTLSTKHRRTRLASQSDDEIVRSKTQCTPRPIVQSSVNKVRKTWSSIESNKKASYSSVKDQFLTPGKQFYQGISPTLESKDLSPNRVNAESSRMHQGISTPLQSKDWSPTKDNVQNNLCPLNVTKNDTLCVPVMTLNNNEDSDYDYPRSYYLNNDCHQLNSPESDSVSLNEKSLPSNNKCSRTDSYLFHRNQLHARNMREYEQGSEQTHTGGGGCVRSLSFMDNPRQDRANKERVRKLRSELGLLSKMEEEVNSINSIISNQSMNTSRDSSRLELEQTKETPVEKKRTSRCVIM